MSSTREATLGAAVAAGLPIVGVGNAEAADTSKIINYNHDMEYRRCGKTGWMVSAVCLGDTGNASTRWSRAFSRATTG